MRNGLAWGTPFPLFFRRLLVAAAALAGLASCASITASPPDHPRRVYVLEGPLARLARHAPQFVVGTYGDFHNRIGRPTARKGDQGAPEIFVDPAVPTIYGREERFQTPRQRYTNLIYRVHFEKVPFSLFPFHLSAGSNVGLIVIVTLDDGERPVLVTTVHTCGCYLAIFPTSYLAPEAYPDQWNPGGQRVWGEHLPGLLPLPRTGDGTPGLLVFLRDGTHRVRDIRFEPRAAIRASFDPVPIVLDPMDDLERIPYADGTVSLFEEEGIRKGYVRGSYKPLEMLLVSWWALDLYVGADKAYGDRHTTGNTFYTSLKPWNRCASDMGNFPSFLEFWGWKL